MTGWGKGVCLAIHDGAPSKLLSKLSSPCILKLHNHVNTAVAIKNWRGEGRNEQFFDQIHMALLFPKQR